MATQPEVLTWIEQHLSGPTQYAGVELAARYFATTERWGERMPMLKHARLNLELQEQVPNIDPAERWITEMPIALDSSEQRSLGRVLRALVSVSQASVDAL